MQLLERDSALAALLQYAGDAAGGDGRLVLVAGEAGVGKSSLIERLERERPDTQFRWGACDGMSTPRPLGPLFDLAAQFGGDLLDRMRAQAGREELYAALLAQMSDPGRATIVVIEDVHWADDATLDLLRFLARRLRSTSAMLVATYRDDGLTAADPLRQALGEWGSHRSTRRVALAPLSRQAVCELARDTGLETDELYDLTGGNPFYISAVLEAGTTTVAPSARDAVWSRAARLSPTAREVLEGAALLGTRVDARDLVAVTPWTPDAMDEVLAGGLLVEEAGRLRFRHEIARRVVENEIPVHRRRAVHARILERWHDPADERGGADDARLAFHAEGAGDRPAILRYAIPAARAAAEMGSHREAAAQYARAVVAAEQIADDRTLADLYTAAAVEAGLLDRCQAAADADERALTLWRRLGDPRREGDTMRHLSTALGTLCRGAEAVDAAHRAVAILEPLGDTQELARAYTALAAMYMMRSDGPRARAWSDRARRIGTELGLPDVVSDALNTTGCVLGFTGEDWRPGLVEALDIALRHGLPVQAGRAYNNIYNAYCEQHDYVEGEAYYVAGTAYCDAHDIGSYELCLQATRTTMLLEVGRWDEALRLSEWLLAHADSSPTNQVCPMTRIGTIKARRGDATAWVELDLALTVAIDSGQLQNIVPIRLFRAEAYWLAGDVEAARAEVEAVTDLTVSDRIWTAGVVDLWLRRTGSTLFVGDDASGPYRAALDGDARAAAAAWRELGCPYDAAMCCSTATTRPICARRSGSSTVSAP